MSEAPDDDADDVPRRAILRAVLRAARGGAWPGPAGSGAAGSGPTSGRRDLDAGLDLLERAAGSMLEACRAQTTTDRYIHAQLGAQRAAAALVVSRVARPGRRGRDGKVTGVWESLRAVAPEFGEWADYLALSGRRRAGLEAGDLPPASREADDLLRGAETFLGLIRAALGLPVTTVEAPLAVARPAGVGAESAALGACRRE